MTMNPITAVTSPDPYEYYAELARERPFYCDLGLGMWVASSAAAVAEVLSNSQCRIRPAAEPVPKALLGSPSGKIFGCLMRMNEGSAHDPLKAAIVAAANSGHVGRCRELARSIANSIMDDTTSPGLSFAVRRLMFELPAATIGRLLGLEAVQTSALAAQVSAFVNGLAADATAEQRVAGDCAADALSSLFRHLVEHRREGPLLQMFRAGCAHRGVTHEIIAANAIGLLFQTYDATAGLIGNSLRYLKRNHNLAAGISRNPRQLEEFVEEISRTDPSIHNTRRYTAVATVVAGNALPAEAQILLILAAANHDAPKGRTGNGQPSFTFGSGIHQCPGQSLALQIGAAAIEAVLSRGDSLDTLAETGRFKASPNARVPLF